MNPRTLARWADDGLIRHMTTLGGQRRYATADVERVKDGRGT